MTEYHFNAELARHHGVNGAVFLHAMAFWVAKNQANGRHFHEGRTWTYNTLEALAKLFPFWTRRQVERIVAKLKQEGALLTGNFSEDKTDRTVWYALADRVLEAYGLLDTPALPDGDMAPPDGEERPAPISPDGDMAPDNGEERPAPISPNGEMHITKSGQPFHQAVKCNKETVTDQLYPPISPGGGRRGGAGLDETVKALLREYAAGDTELADSLDALMEIRAAKKAVDSARAVKTLLNRLDRLAEGSREAKLQVLEQSVTNSWKGVFPLKGGQAPPRKEPKRYVE